MVYNEESDSVTLTGGTIYIYANFKNIKDKF